MSAEPGAGQRSVFRRRKDANEYRKISSEDKKKYLEDGWQVHKEMTSHSWVKKPKSAEIMLEDRIWCLFYRMGYTTISGANFRIEFKKSDGSPGSKRINVLAADDETVVVVECRAREHRGRRSLQKDIDDLETSQKKLAQSIRSSLSKGANPAHLYLWCPNTLLPEGLAVMKAWGFNYKSNIVWHKVRKDGGSDGRGVGFYFRNVTEIIMFGVRGKNARTLAPGRRQVNLLATRKREHSRKPDEQYEIIEACSPGPYLELFARGTRKNWIVWGNQADDAYRPTWKTYAHHSRAELTASA